MSEKGQIVVPKEARDKHGFGKGSAFAFLETSNGQLVFRPVNPKPKLSLIEHLRKFKGLEIPELKAHCPPRL
jgi:AbrB family looped-hinge helix DNA binding protein